MKTYYNSHVHIFSKKCIPVYILGNNLSYLIKALDWLQMNRFVIFLLSVFKVLPITREAIPRLKMFFRSFAQGSQHEVIEHLLYQEYDRFSESGSFKIVLLSIDFDSQNAGLAPLNYLNQINEIAEYKRLKPYRDRILPFIGINPYHTIFINLPIEDFVKEYIEVHQFVGVKLYPATGYYPDDSRMEKLWAYCEKNDIPIMSHCTCGRIHYQGDASERLRTPSLFPNMTGDDQQVNFTDTENFKALLVKYPKLKICFAHCGGIVFSKNNQNELEQKLISKNFDSPRVIEYKWYKQVLAWCQSTDYPNIYLDISLINHDRKTLEDLRDEVIKHNIMHKVLYGTDFFVNIDKTTEEDAYLLSKQIFNMDIIASENPQKYLRSLIHGDL